MSDSVVILLSSDSDSCHSNSPPSQSSYLCDDGYSSKTLRLGLDQNKSSISPRPSLFDEWSQTKDVSLEDAILSTKVGNRVAHDLSCSDFSDEDLGGVSPGLGPDSDEHACNDVRPSPQPYSDKDSDLDISLEPWIGLGLGLGLDRVQGIEQDSHNERNKCDVQVSPLGSERWSGTHSGNSVDYKLDKDLVAGLDNKKKTISKKTSVEEKRLAAKMKKEAREAEKVKKLAEKAELKAAKQALAKARQVIKPEECIKYLSVLLDNNIFEVDLGGNLYNELEATGIMYSVQSQLVPLSITWVRKIPAANDSSNNTPVKHEEHSLLILPCDQLIKLIKNQELCNYVKGVQAVVPKNRFTLILYGIENFFMPQKKKKAKEDFKISRDELTEALVEVQLFTNCDHRFVENCSELATTIALFSKAVAEIPHKLEKQKKEQDKLDWFGESDSRDCVRVDKNGNGLLRLWRQQLCEFNLAGLEIAEAITVVYQSPQALFQAYDCCSSQNKKETMLQDIPIRRGVGVLSSVRRIGPELSKKLYNFFTTLDGDVDLAND